jgi:hypothetical protein
VPVSGRPQGLSRGCAREQTAQAQTTDKRRRILRPTLLGSRSPSARARCGIATLVRRTLLTLATCAAEAAAASPSARCRWVPRSSRSGAGTRGHHALVELHPLQSLTTRWRPRICCSFAVPLMRFGPLQHTRNAGFTINDPGLPHPVRSASRVSHPPDGLPPRTPPRPCFMPQALMGFSPSELLPAHEP